LERVNKTTYWSCNKYIKEKKSGYPQQNFPTTPWNKLHIGAFFYIDPSNQWMAIDKCDATIPES
jgi:hypothetical protein